MCEYSAGMHLCFRNFEKIMVYMRKNMNSLVASRFRIPAKNGHFCQEINKKSNF
jgi:hypothetical protein